MPGGDPQGETLALVEAVTKLSAQQAPTRTPLMPDA